jgi:hypothetical protein
VDAVQRRYRDYCAALHVETIRSLAPWEVIEGDDHWIYPIMEEVVLGIEENDVGCIALGVDFVEEDAHFSFGATLKSNTAPALHRSDSTEL